MPDAMPDLSTTPSPPAGERTLAGDAEPDRTKAPAPQDAYWDFCPNCTARLHNVGCKYRCPDCHYFLSCSDFD
jgi:hypothetical protein